MVDNPCDAKIISSIVYTTRTRTHKCKRTHTQTQMNRYLKKKMQPKICVKGITCLKTKVNQMLIGALTEINVYLYPESSTAVMI